MKKKPCEAIVVPDGQDEGSIELIEESIDHMKIILLLNHLNEEKEWVEGNEIFQFLLKCSQLGLGFRMVEPNTKNFQKVLEERINFLLIDLYNLAHIDVQDNDKGEFVQFSVSDEEFDEFGGLASLGPEEHFLLLSAVHSMNELNNIHDQPLIQYDDESKTWIPSFKQCVMA